MPSNRPKARYKPGYGKNGKRIVRQPPPRKTPDQLANERIALLEKKYGLTPSKVATMILKERGMLTQACRSLKIPRTTLQRYIERNDVCMEAMDHARAAMGDKAESKLFELIEAGDVRCILYYLSTVHRHRGYGMRPEDINAVDNGGRGPVFVETVNIVGIPSGTFLPKEIAAKDSMVIENVR